MPVFVEKYPHDLYECVGCHIKGIHPRDTSSHVFPDLPTTAAMGTLRKHAENIDSIKEIVKLLNSNLESQKIESFGLEEMDDLPELLLKEHDNFFYEIAVRAKRGMSFQHSRQLQLEDMKESTTNAEIAFHLVSYKFEFLGQVTEESPIFHITNSKKDFFAKIVSSLTLATALPENLDNLSPSSMTSAQNLFDEYGLLVPDLARCILQLPFMISAEAMVKLEADVIDKSLNLLLTADNLKFKPKITPKRHKDIHKQVLKAEEFYDDPWSSDFVIAKKVRRKAYFGITFTLSLFILSVLYLRKKFPGLKV
ncbi:uncharacterized protein SAPINGB_P002346 [Magnusiomyces paraingens]|uniref:Uncharacterized protein n=1 Tax=Magnusiomyces paraingens TaxID=2606893 RepID=A0A5E8BDC5_9ASCO|nr:uncharacterized protein SAPINGB_P002346 [Saprochaete ingens]VVT49593.1 unnamed protein product [Saprochaete ingens]